MIKAIVIFLANVTATAMLYPAFINFLYRFSLREKIRNDGPKTHLVKQGTPTMGGLAFILSVGILTIFFNKSAYYGYFLAGITFLAGILGLMEDLFKIYSHSHFQDAFRSSLNPIVTMSSLTSKAYNKLLLPWDLFKEFWRTVGSTTDVGLQTYQKFILQSVIAVVCSYFLFVVFGYNTLWMPLFGHFHLGIFYPVFVYLVFIVVLNSVAFTDGLDGLAGGLAFIAFIFFWVIAEMLNIYPVSLYLAAFLGALLPFLYFNVFPARIFMGNVGSFALGAAIAVVALLLHREVAIIFIAFPFLIDGMSSVFQQLSVRLTGKRIFLMAPLHHHFELMGWVETKVVFRFYLLAIFSGFVGLLISLI
ncbi:hypothetical protein COT49_02650 [candidate division WWE3 bacterium CG08_land_8_20_14_0_20_40_13]|uniref:Phospho-N-acetylmuramoyl-pentapeptide-transferase n=1 Tax=candidate division WWE3 bacterium CG08_land_8_20_14_0_20_40_13 TaxID=1975084 RepID=A0A2H0XDF8_UNCKA|nr:MAG: hypothetical protein COT49_02650 [candidate division WWE3 bacterium CG08_land_8_20_14_0_20_40_13]